jgi:hypothetical protein
MRRAWALTVGALALACGAHAFAQSAPPRGGARLTRVADPVAACNVMLMGAIAAARPGARFDPGRPRVERAGEITVVAWSVEFAGVRGRKSAVCRAEPGRIASLTLDGVETLTQPQPY